MAGHCDKLIDNISINYYDCKKDETESAGQDMPNIEKKLNAVIVINTREGDLSLIHI